jgi:LysM domain
MIGIAMQPRSRARYLAPIALAAVLAGTYVVAHSVLSHKAAPVHHARGHVRRGPRRRFYVVAPGDNLTAIANKTGIPVGEIETLNPNVDPNSLQTGQRLRLRR